MATAPLTFASYTGWVDVVDPLNIPPSARKIKAADLLRYERALDSVVTRSNAHSAQNDAVLRPVASGWTVRALPTTTAGRPSASATGAGTTLFDTTLGRPVWSNGTAWVDATGTIV